MKRIGWIGTGVMGQSMASHILKAGYPVTVYTRTKNKAEDLLKSGAEWAASPRETAEKSDIIFSIVGYPKDVEEVILGDDGILSGAGEGSILVDMTTSEPALAERIYTSAKKKGIGSLDAPVSGGDIGARNGTLAIMAGGDKEHYNEVMPLFQCMGENIALMGKAGAGQHTKMCNQILIAGTMIGAVESLLYAYKAGIDSDAVIDVIGKGAASSWTINNLGRRIASRDYAPGFYVKHFVKDMGIALSEARRMNLALPGLALVNQFYTAAMGSGWEELGTQSLFKVLAKMNGEDV